MKVLAIHEAPLLREVPLVVRVGVRPHSLLIWRWLRLGTHLTPALTAHHALVKLVVLTRTPIVGTLTANYTLV
jgi:hypothetical protein